MVMTDDGPVSMCEHNARRDEFILKPIPLASGKASPVLLEPVMAVEVETPEDFMGNVLGDLSSRRSRMRLESS